MSRGVAAVLAALGAILFQMLCWAACVAMSNNRHFALLLLLWLGRWVVSQVFSAEHAVHALYGRSSRRGREGKGGWNSQGGYDDAVAGDVSNRRRRRVRRGADDGFYVSSWP